MSTIAQRTHAIVLGKFLPLHTGHVGLFHAARAVADDVTIVIGPRDDEPIPAAVRVTWVHDVAPWAQIRLVSSQLYSTPELALSKDIFWAQWTAALREAVPTATHIVSSELYGEEIARRLGLTHVLHEIDRQTFPISGTQVRHDPHAHWDFVPVEVRPAFRRVVVIAGGESCGKSTLAEALTSRVPSRGSLIREWGRTHTIGMSLDTFSPRDALAIGWAQTRQLRRRMTSASAPPIVFSDTDPVATLVWSELLGASVDERLVALAEEWPRHGVLLCAPDVAWVDDGTRAHAAPDTRHWFFTRVQEHYQRLGHPVRVVEGTGTARLRSAEMGLAALASDWWAPLRHWHQDFPLVPLPCPLRPVDWGTDWDAPWVSS